MATNTNLNDVFFSQSVSNLGSKKIGVGMDAFESQFASQMYDPELTKPEGYEVPEIEEDKQEIDVPGGSQALETDISDAVMLFTDEEKEKERKRLGTYVDPTTAQLQNLGPFGSDVSAITATIPQRRGIGVSNVPAIAPYERGTSTMETGTIDEEEILPPSGDRPIGLGELERGYDAGRDIYSLFNNQQSSYYGQDMATTSAVAGGRYLGSGVNLSTYGKNFSTGLGTTATQGSVGLSSAPPASLAGQGTGLTMTPYVGSATTSAAPIGYGAIGSQAGNVASRGFSGTGYGGINKGSAGSWSGALKGVGTALQIYGIHQAFSSGTAEGKVSGTLQTAALMNPALGPYVAAYEAIKMLTGWGGIGKWFRGGGYKHPMGGVEFRLTSQKYMDKYNGIPPSDGSDQAAWLNAGNPEFDEAAENDTLRLTAPYSWGYNGFPHPEVKKQAEKQIDYLYSFADRYGLDVNEQTFIKAATGSGGFEKHKPSGDRGVSVLERIDSIGNGSETANQWLREVFEYTGPNGEKIVSGTPRSQNINQQSGLYDGFATQEDFEADVDKFSQEFYS